jgi:hypothetical protein
MIYYGITICSIKTLITIYDGNRCNTYNRNKLVIYKCLARAHGNKIIGLCQLSLFIGNCFHDALHILSLIVYYIYMLIVCVSHIISHGNI